MQSTWANAVGRSQIIRNGALEQLKNEVDIQTVCGHHPFIDQCIAFWQTHRQICIRKWGARLMCSLNPSSHCGFVVLQ